MAAGGGASKRALEIELRDLMRAPLEGFTVNLADDSDLFAWSISIFGPPDTLYQGGYFKASMTFPADYPYNPPVLKFLTPMFHPNIYRSGEVCISILHSPGADATSGELPSERWNPIQNVRTILLSVVSMLSEPNDSSPANVDAGKMFRENHAGYTSRVKEIVTKTEADATRDGVTVPKTLADYCHVNKEKSTEQDDLLDDLDDDYMYDCDDDDVDINYSDDGDDDDDVVGDQGDAKKATEEDNDSGMSWERRRR